MTSIGPFYDATILQHMDNLTLIGSCFNTPNGFEIDPHLASIPNSFQIVSI